MNRYVTQENEQRTAKYRKDRQREQAIRDMNAALAPLEIYEPSSIDRPSLFIFGLPRSGTTLAYQLFAHCLDIGYVNNLIARFWLAPLAGIALSREVLGTRAEATFESDYGKTRGPQGPHEFAYFWQHWLGIEDVEDLIRFNQPAPHVDWGKLGRVVRSMQDGFDSGIVFKTMYAANHVREFAATFPMPLFIHVDRDPTAVALSILSARKSYYGTPDTWWATYPPDYSALRNLGFAEQIAGQVAGLRLAYEEAMALLDPEVVVRLSYRDLCAAPELALQKVRTRLRSLYGYDQAFAGRAPPSFEPRERVAGTAADEQALAAALAARGLRG
ncbi:MAG: sulfotransferase [Burkholderiales bacterium]|nr:sulfotransferase [Burkholderiales bacterium]